jgi:hypothetical protein
MTSIDITGYGIVTDPRVPEYVVFLITVQQPPGASWAIYRRYLSFLNLGEQLSQRIPGIPECPVKRIFSPESTVEFEIARREHLAWLSQVRWRYQLNSITFFSAGPVYSRSSPIKAGP